MSGEAKGPMISAVSQAAIEERCPIMAYFRYDHLPPHLQMRSKPFCDLAYHIVKNTPDNAERAVALRKLLEAKDAGVRAFVGV